MIPRPGTLLVSDRLMEGEHYKDVLLNTCLNRLVYLFSSRNDSWMKTLFYLRGKHLGLMMNLKCCRVSNSFQSPHRFCEAWIPEFNITSNTERQKIYIHLLIKS